MSLSTNIRRSFQVHCYDGAIRALAPNTIKFCKLVKQDKNWSVSLRKIIFFRIMLYDTTGVLSRSSSKHTAIRTVFYFSSCQEEEAALLRHLTDDRLRGVLSGSAGLLRPANPEFAGSKTLFTQLN